MLDLNVGYGCRFFPGAQGMLAILRDLKTRHSRPTEPVHHSRERAIAFAGKIYRLTVSHEAGAGPHGAIGALRLECTEFPGRRAVVVLEQEHLIGLSRADSATD